LVDSTQSERQAEIGVDSTSLIIVWKADN